MIVSLTTVEGLSSAFNVVRKSVENYELTKIDLTIDLQRDDLYLDDNTVSIIFLYMIP